ncbi:MAG: hypothetical protein U1A27_04340 [Phycisphaerae bacterium]
MRRLGLLLAGAAVTLLACGCPPPAAPPARPRVPRPLSEVIATVNENAARVDRPMYASPLRVNADVADSNDRIHRFSFEGALLVRKPDELRLDLRHGLGGEPIMQVATNGAEYWAWIVPEVSTYWWGRRAHLGEPCVTTIPVRPEQLAEVLGMNPLPEGRTDLLGPARLYEERFDRLLYSRPRGAAYEFDREYWIDGEPPYLVRRVIFRDAYGRQAMHAEIDDCAAAWEAGPLVARRIRVFWPSVRVGGAESRMELTVANWRDPGRISRRAFERPVEAPPGVTHTVQVDAACDEAGHSSSAPATQPAGDAPDSAAGT